MAFIYLKQYLLLDYIVTCYDEFVVKIWVTKRGLQKASKVPILAVFVILAMFVITLAKRVEYSFFRFFDLKDPKIEIHNFKI